MSKDDDRADAEKALLRFVACALNEYEEAPGELTLLAYAAATDDERASLSECQSKPPSLARSQIMMAHVAMITARICMDSVEDRQKWM